MKHYLKLIRVKHWLKNVLIFAPLFFSISLLNLDLLLTCGLAFFVFSFASSIVYVINDMSDIEKDRLHPIKKKRPLASGAIKIPQAIMTLIVLAVMVIALSICLYFRNNDILVFVVPLIYILINILYSKWLKHIPIIDVVTLVSGFLLRVIYGGIVINVDVSKWLYLMVIFGAFYIGFGKRRNEIMKNGGKSRKVLEAYNKEFLDKNMYVALSLAIVSYSLWCVDPATIARIGSDYMFWTIPILMVIFQLYSINIEGDSHGDPIEVVLADKFLIGAVLFYMIVMVFLLYIL